MSGKRTKRFLFDPERVPAGQTDWAALEAMDDREADAAAQADPDAQPASEDELAAARPLYPPGTEPVLLTIERDVIEWFRRRSGSEDYRSRINAVLKEYVAARR